MNTANPLTTALVTQCACVLLGLTTTLHAQTTPAAPERQATASGFDIVIADGVLTHRGKTIEATLDNVLDMLRDRHPEANIIVTPGIPEVRIDDLKIRASDLHMELEALRVASGERFVLRLAGSSENWLYVLEPTPVPPQDRLRVEAFGLGEYFASLPQGDSLDENIALIRERVEELQKIVRETVAAYQDMERDVSRGSGSRNNALDMRFHPGANLLILIGDPESIEVAGRVIGALPHAQSSGAGRAFWALPELYGGRRAVGTGVYPGFEPGARAPHGKPFGSTGYEDRGRVLRPVEGLEEPH